MADNIPNTDVGGWFAGHGLPYNADMANTLAEWGLTNVEEFKLLDTEDFLSLFKNEKIIIKRKAEVVWYELGGKKTFNSKRSATHLPLNQPSCKQQKSANDPTTSRALKPNQWKQYSLLNKGFSSRIIKTREELRLEREFRQQRKADEDQEGVLP